MTENELIIYHDFEAVIRLVLDGLGSENSRRSYQRSLVDFLAWYQDKGKPGLSKGVLQEYRATLQAAGNCNATINLRMAALRKLVQEAADNNLIDQSTAAGVLRIKSLNQHGQRSGVWLTQEQARALLDAPDTTTLKGLRDKALLSVMIGGGLRRSEIANLTLDRIQKRDGRWAVVDIVGKANHVRSVPIPTFAKAAIDEWVNAANIKSGFIFLALDRGMVKTGKVKNMSTQGIFLVVDEYGRKIGVDLACHDLRRTFAKLAHTGGSGLEQIQLSLGHASLMTTERYLGVRQSFTDAPADHLGL